jgi:hypothetical protein
MPETAIELRELREMASEALYWDNPARIRRVWDLKTQWIPYTRAEFLISKAEELLNRPKAPRLPCLLVYADPNSGMTALLRRYGELHPIDSNRGGNAIHAPVIGIEIRSPDEGSLYNSILKAIQAPFKIQDRVQKKRNQILTILEKIGTRQLLLDELNTAISGPLLKQRNFLVALKNLLNEIQMTVFATGTPDARIALHLTSNWKAASRWKSCDGGPMAKNSDSYLRASNADYPFGSRPSCKPPHLRKEFMS